MKNNRAFAQMDLVSYYMSKLSPSVKRALVDWEQHAFKGCTQGLQRDVVYLGWPMAHSYMSPNAGGGSCGVSANKYTSAEEDPK